MNVERIIKGVVSIAIIGLVLGLIWYFWQIVLYIILAAILSLVGRPLVVKLLRIRLFNHFSRGHHPCCYVGGRWASLCALYSPTLWQGSRVGGYGLGWRHCRYRVLDKQLKSYASAHILVGV